MRKSTIAKIHARGAGTPFAQALGRELRRRRRERGLRQADVAEPMTASFVSAVELGYTVPSLPALALMAERLDVSLSELFGAVSAELGDPDPS